MPPSHLHDVAPASPRRPSGIAAAIAAQAAADAAAAIPSDVDSDEEAMGILNALRRSRSNPRTALTSSAVQGSAQGSAQTLPLVGCAAEKSARSCGGAGGNGAGVYANRSAGNLVKGRRSLDSTRISGDFRNQHHRGGETEKAISPSSSSDYYVPLQRQGSFASGLNSAGSLGGSTGSRMKHVAGSTGRLASLLPTERTRPSSSHAFVDRNGPACKVDTEGGVGREVGEGATSSGGKVRREGGRASEVGNMSEGGVCERTRRYGLGRGRKGEGGGGEGGGGGGGGGGGRGEGEGGLDTPAARDRSSDLLWEAERREEERRERIAEEMQMRGWGGVEGSAREWGGVGGSRSFTIGRREKLAGVAERGLLTDSQGSRSCSWLRSSSTSGSSSGSIGVGRSSSGSIGIGGSSGSFSVASSSGSIGINNSGSNIGSSSNIRSSDTISGIGSSSCSRGLIPSAPVGSAAAAAAAAAADAEINLDAIFAMYSAAVKRRADVTHARRFEYEDEEEYEEGGRDAEVSEEMFRHSGIAGVEGWSGREEVLPVVARGLEQRREASYGDTRRRAGFTGFRKPDPDDYIEDEDDELDFGLPIKSRSMTVRSASRYSAVEYGLETGAGEQGMGGPD
ncbi:unnamed protein product [Closterium sp. NIES-53]